MLKYPKLFVNYLKTATPLLSNKTDYLLQQTRNTFILKRRYPVRLHKKDGRPHMLKSRHYIYDLVEDTNVRKKEPLDLILMQYVKGLGNTGTRISMPPNKAYKTLLLPRLADYATPENIEKYTKLAIDKADDIPFSSITVENTIKYLSQMRLLVAMSKDVPWTLEKWHVKTSFRKTGIHVSEDAITMPERTISGPNMDIQGKEFYVIITINNREKVTVRCFLHHWTPDKFVQSDIEDSWMLPAEPIFPEDKPILDSLPPFYRKQKIVI